MQITQVSVSVGRTQNTGNFNSLRYDLTATANLEEGETAPEAIEEMTAALKAQAKAYLWEAKETYVEDWPASPR